MVYAMFSLVILTMLVGVIAVSARFVSIKSGQMPIEYLALMQGQGATEAVTKTTRCFNNLFEVPVLFYIVSTLYIALGIESNLADIMAWVFVVFRLAQAYVHITYNYVRHRMLAFGGSMLSVLLLWINLIVLRL